ncbi:MAG: ATP-dependent DNA helicase RecG [Deltaproteobacteria bacterium]|nr:ATP-dependent DNA helicase RecG [Deltaproteobacteria bacterium]
MIRKREGPGTVASSSRSLNVNPSPGRAPVPLPPNRPSHNIAEIPIRFIPGVGPRIAELFLQKGIQTAEDLLYFFPYKYLDRSRLESIRNLKVGQASVVGRVLSSGLLFFGRGKRRLFEVLLGDETGAVSLKWFHFYPQQMKGRFQKGQALLVSGEVTLYRGEPQFVHPQVELLEADLLDEVAAPGIIPTYSQISGLGQKTVRKVIRNCFERASFSDPLPEELRTRRRLVPKKEALYGIHFPAPDSSVEELNNGRSAGHYREIFEEFFLMELGLALKRRQARGEPGIPFTIEETRRVDWQGQLPFDLTKAQRQALNEIYSDMGRGAPMNRLLQGDVGSGKTIVSLLAAVAAIENGYQVALMAPTEILAEQHCRTAQKILAPFKIPVGLLLGSQTALEKERNRSRIRRGLFSLVIGTHALISDGVQFAKLGLVIIDEQHRFGVLQRMALRQKGEEGSLVPDVLVMTATPIPRTLAMTVYGDLDLSIIDEMPPGRQPTRTQVIESRNRGMLYGIIREVLERKEQGYVVYPLIEESEKLALKDATQMCEELKKILPEHRIALLHGRIVADEKETIFRKFRAGEVDLLVSTTVIEVGVDVPNATLMVIEHADRFGLSQLHQLRGRIGRGAKAGSCLLVSDYRKTENAYRRLEVMCATNDGFRIAEEDLKIRGAGDFLGTRQSGLPDLRVANLLRDYPILKVAREEAFQLIDNDPGLLSHSVLKQELLRRWKERLALSDVG